MTHKEGSGTRFNVYEYNGRSTTILNKAQYAKRHMWGVQELKSMFMSTMADPLPCQMTPSTHDNTQGLGSSVHEHNMWVEGLGQRWRGVTKGHTFTGGE